MRFVGRNQDGTLVEFPFKPWMDTKKWKWCIQKDDDSIDYGTPIEETDETKDIKFEDNAKMFDE